GWFPPMQGDDFFLAGTGAFGHIRKVMAVFTAIAAGYCHQATAGISASQVGFPQHMLYFCLQATAAGVRAEVRRQVVHGYGVEGGDNIADTADACLAQGRCSCGAAPADCDIDAAAETQYQAAITV